MKMYLISDNVDTLTACVLAGVTAWWCMSARELRQALETALA